MDAVSAFAAGIDHKIHVKHDSREDLIRDPDDEPTPIRVSMVASSDSTESDITVLPEEVCVISIGSDDSDRARIRKEKAQKRKRELQQQQKSYMEFMAMFYPHDAHIKTHREFLEDQKRRMKAIYRI